jgi:hypothetical protein
MMEGSKSPRGRVRLQEGMEEGKWERVNKGGLRYQWGLRKKLSQEKSKSPAAAAVRRIFQAAF